MHLVLCLVGLPLLPLDLGPARGVGVPLGIRLAWAVSLPLLILLREEEERELPALDRCPFPASPSLWTPPNSHRTYHDVRIRGSLQPLAPALYPPTIHALRGVNRGRIRGLGLERVALVAVAVAPALTPLPVRGQEGVSVGGGHRPRHALLVVALGVEALGHDVSGRGLLTATAPIVSVRVPLPVGGSGSRSHAPSNRSHDRDYLLLLPACGLTKRDDWPDKEPRRVRRRLPPSLLWLLERRRMLLLLQEGHP